MFAYGFGVGDPAAFTQAADNWSLKELVAGLTDQLAGQYLRAVNSNYGIYAVGYKGEKGYWEETETWRRLHFADPIGHLENTAGAMTLSRQDIDDLRVFGIDFSLRADKTC